MNKWIIRAAATSFVTAGIVAAGSVGAHADDTIGLPTDQISAPVNPSDLGDSGSMPGLDSLTSPSGSNPLEMLEQLQTLTDQVPTDAAGDPLSRPQRAAETPVDMPAGDVPEVPGVSNESITELVSMIASDFSTNGFYY